MAACFFAVAVTKIMCDSSENQEKQNYMKEARYLIMVLMVLLCGESFAASPYKVEERSGRKPSWVGKTEKGYIIFSSTGSSLEEARDKCMESIKQEIVQAVAVNVSSEILSTSRQLSENGKYDLYEEYRSDIKSVAARLPFVNDITIANAEASYWERRLNKQTGERIYEFCVKYPFPKAKREMMIAEFKEYDKQQYDKFLKLKEACTSINTVEEIGRYLSEVEPFVAYFFDETRFKEAVALRDMLRGMYNGIAVVEVSNTPGEYIYKLVYDNRDFTLSRLPRVKSDYAYEATAQPVGNGLYAVRYGYEGCVPEEENSVELLFNFGGTTRKHVFYFSPEVANATLIPQGTVRITVQPAATDSVLCDTLTMTFDVRSNVAMDYQVTRLNVFLPEYPVLQLLPDEAVGSLVDGTNTVVMRMEGKRSPEARSASLTSGTFTIKERTSGKEQVISLRLPYKIVY